MWEGESIPIAFKNKLCSTVKIKLASSHLNYGKTACY